MQGVIVWYLNRLCGLFAYPPLMSFQSSTPAQILRLLVDGMTNTGF